MEILTIKETMQIFASIIKKPCIYISFGDGINSIRAAPYLDLKKHDQVISDGIGILVCNNQDEMERYYKMTIGDDGPTELNPYNGIYRVYALVCDAEGRFIGENT